MEQMNLFTSTNIAYEPLAARLRPKNLDEYIGQEHLVGEGKPLRNLIESDHITSMILWGPPGVGKTTLARIIANKTKAEFVNFSAVTSGIKEIRAVMEQADENRHFGKRTILFVDEIHRFNKAQQDAFLPYVEKGSIILIGATTENPSFEINNALLSRCRVFVLKGLDEKDIEKVLKRAVESPEGYKNRPLEIEDGILEKIAVFSNGDARAALSTFEIAVENGRLTSDGVIHIDKDTFELITSKRSFLYDKKDENHYNLISALHKSMRNSDPDAAVYYLARMLEAGEDPMYIARRVTRFAAEDVGLADPQALTLAVSMQTAVKLIGMPECNVHLTEAVIYMALAPKSNACETAYLSAASDVHEKPDEPVPLQIRNAETDLMKELGYNNGYMYAHDYPEKLTEMECLPDSMKGTRYYYPGDQGREIEFSERLEYIRNWKAKKRGEK
jgi:putative ATPase